MTSFRYNVLAEVQYPRIQFADTVILQYYGVRLFPSIIALVTLVGIS